MLTARDPGADRGSIERETAAALRPAAGLRNRIARGSALFDYERVHREARTGLVPLRRFLAAVATAAEVGDAE